MSGQGSYGGMGGGDATSSAAGCALREGTIAESSSPLRRRLHSGAAAAQFPGSISSTGESSTASLYGNYELACFLWGRGEDGQLGIGDTR